MKQQLYLAFISILVLLACSRPKPDDTVVLFLNCMQKANFSEAKKYGTESTCLFLDKYKHALPDANPKNDSIYPIKIIESNTNGNTAVVKYIFLGKTAEIDLIYKNDKWLVNLKMN